MLDLKATLAKILNSLIIKQTVSVVESTYSVYMWTFGPLKIMYYYVGTGAYGTTYTYDLSPYFNSIMVAIPLNASLGFSAGDSLSISWNASTRVVQLFQYNTAGANMNMALFILGF